MTSWKNALWVVSYTTTNYLFVGQILPFNELKHMIKEAGLFYAKYKNTMTKELLIIGEDVNGDPIVQARPR